MRRSRYIWLALVAATAAMPLIASAQDKARGFMFYEPRGSVTFRSGLALANANSDLFDFTTRQLTIDRGDFNALGFDVDADFALSPRTRLQFSLGVAATSHRSEFRDYVDNNELPIEQTTAFVRVPITAGVKRYLTPTGRAIGRLAWVPTRFAPYLNAGAGIMYYRFRQSGDFVDFQTMDVFNGQFVSSGWAPIVHVGGGLDYSLNAKVALTADARYRWGKGTLSEDFVGFGRLDLSGLATTAGLAVRF